MNDQPDLLTDVLRQAGLRRRLLDVRHLPPRAALRFPCERSIGLHLVTRGTVHVHAAGLDAPLALAVGDMALMARGCVHVLSPQSDLAQADAVQPLSFATSADAPAAPEGGSAVISGAYQLWHAPLHPLFAQLPAWFVLRAAELPRLGPLSLAASLLSGELDARGPAADTIVHGLLDAVFGYLMRELQQRAAAGQPGWATAVSDRAVHAVLALMHADCAQPWTLERLAARAGLSRTGLAERFRTAMGDTPLSYLRTLRMQHAMRLLEDTDRSLEQLAREVGYTDAFSFSKVFKREVGSSPGDYRRRDRQERGSPWRIRSA